MKTAVCILLVTLSQSWAQDPNYFSRAICGQARFCVSQPSDCDPQLTDSCDAFASWKLSGDGTKLELALYATTATYVAFGFSNSGSMARSDVYACTTNNDVIRSWNRDGYGNEERTLKGVSGETVSSTNGVISCQFSRDLSLNDGDQEFFDLTSFQSVYALMAWNGPLQSSTRLGRHPLQVGRFYWTQPIDFTQTLPAVTTMPTNPMTAIISESPFTGTEEQPMTSIISESPITGTEAQQSPATEQTSPVTSSGSSPVSESSLDGEILFSRSVCGQSRFCASKPEGCDPQMGSCDAFSSWKLSGDGTKVEFALYAKTMTYIAMGLTGTPSMDNSDVYACATGNNNILRSRNVGYSNSDLVLKGVSDATIAYADGVITCKFTRVLSLGSEDSEFFDLTSGNFHIIMSWGGSLSGSSLRKHLSTFVGDSFDFTQSVPEVATTREMVRGYLSDKFLSEEIII